MDKQRVIEDQVALVRETILRDASFYALWGTALSAGLSLGPSLEYVRSAAPQLVPPYAGIVVEAFQTDANVGQKLRDAGESIHPVAQEIFAVQCLSGDERGRDYQRVGTSIRQARLPHTEAASVDEVASLLRASYSPERTLLGSLSSVCKYLTEEAAFQFFRASHGLLEDRDGHQVLFLRRFGHLLDSRVPLDQSFSASANSGFPSPAFVEEVTDKVKSGVSFVDALGSSNYFPAEVVDIFALATSGMEGLTMDDCRGAVVSSLREYMPPLEAGYKAKASAVEQS